jgi:uncharacterized protein GlcG (DUF336 family)
MGAVLVWDDRAVPIGLDDANRAVEAALRKAATMGVIVAASVCGTDGQLVAFQRMDGASTIAGRGAQGKAIGCAAGGVPSADVPEELTLPEGMSESDGRRIMRRQGGLPLFRDGELVGAIGVGGAKGEEDEECAAAGVAALGSGWSAS